MCWPCCLCKAWDAFDWNVSKRIKNLISAARRETTVEFQSCYLTQGHWTTINCCETTAYSSLFFTLINGWYWCYYAPLQGIIGVHISLLSRWMWSIINGRMEPLQQICLRWAFSFACHASERAVTCGNRWSLLYCCWMYWLTRPVLWAALIQQWIQSGMNELFQKWNVKWLCSFTAEME
jgi:hypothetical protein